MILLWISDNKKYPSLPKKIKHIYISMVLLLCLFILSTLWSDADMKDMFIYIKKIWYFLPIFIIYKYLKIEYIPYAISSFLYGMLISELLSYGVMFSLWKIRFATPFNPSIFIHHIQYSIFLSITSIMLLFMGLKEKKKISKTVYLTFFITSTLNLFLNIGRTGYVTFLASMLLSYLILYKFKFKTIFLGIMTTTTILFISYSISPNFQTRIHQISLDIKQMTNNDQYDTSIGARIALWIAAVDIIEKHPILGVGVAEHLNQKNKFALSDNNKKFKFLTKIAHFHNSFLEILTQLGLLGLSLFIYILYLIATLPIKDPNTKVFQISLISIFVLGSFADRLFHLNSTISLFSFILALILIQFRIEKTKELL